MRGPSKVPTQWKTNNPVPVGWMRQFRYLAELYCFVEKTVLGDVVECGLGEGDTFTMLAYLVGSEEIPYKRTLRGYDSFEGWPEPSEWDASPRNPQRGEWAVSEEAVIQRLTESGIYRAFPGLDIRTIKGFLNESLPGDPMTDREIAFLHLDLDLYDGYRDALVHLFPHVAVGGVVAFDEYKEFPNTPEYGHGQTEKWPGCTKAVDEYFAGRPERLRRYSENGKYFLIKIAP